MQTTEQYLGPFWAVSSLSIKTKNRAGAPLHDLQLKTAQMMRQATHCFEPQKKAFGWRYVMPLYVSSCD